MENPDGNPLGKNLSDFCPKSRSKGPDLSPIARETQVTQHAEAWLGKYLVCNPTRKQTIYT